MTAASPSTDMPPLAGLGIEDGRDNGTDGFRWRSSEGFHGFPPAQGRQQPLSFPPPPWAAPV